MSETPSTPPTSSVTLPTWEWHHVLKDLEDIMRICNRDNGPTEILYGKIASQLAGYEVKVEQRQPKPKSSPTPAKAVSDKPTVKPWYKRILS